MPTPAESFMADIERDWRFDGMFHHFLLEGEQVGAIEVGPIEEEDSIPIGLLIVSRFRRGQGIGSKILDAVCAAADRHEVALEITVIPTGAVEEADLIAWYRRRNFELLDPAPFDEGPRMSRSPRPEPEPAP
jgi:GNAT superfamily N-acetyltransferase